MVHHLIVKVGELQEVFLQERVGPLIEGKLFKPEIQHPGIKGMKGRNVIKFTVRNTVIRLVGCESDKRLKTLIHLLCVTNIFGTLNIFKIGTLNMSEKYPGTKDGIRNRDLSNQ